MSDLPERLTTFANWLPVGQADAKKLLAEAASHIAELEATIEAAPHGVWCEANDSEDCVCWKSGAAAVGRNRKKAS